MTKEILDEIIKRRHREGKTLSIQRINDEELTYSQIRERARKYYGSWSDALKNNGVTPYKNDYFSKEETAEELKRLQEQGSRMRLKDFPPKLVKSIQKHYGGYTAAKKELGIKVRRKKGSGGVKRPLNEVLRELQESLPYINDKSDYMNKYAHIYNYSLKHYGDGYEVFRLIGEEKPPNKRKYPDKQSIINAIIRYESQGVEIHGRNISREDSTLYSSAIQLFPSWGKAVEAAGFDYEEVKDSGLKYSPLTMYGYEFEDIFAEILTELGYEYIRDGEGVNKDIPGFALKPDFILSDWRWIDCKLSEGTDIYDMLKRYHEYKPKELIVVYLRGKNHQITRGRKYKYKHVSVYQITKLLPEDRRQFYETRLTEIEKRVDESTIAI